MAATRSSNSQACATRKLRNRSYRIPPTMKNPARKKGGKRKWYSPVMWAQNMQLNDLARQGDFVKEAAQLIADGADTKCTNGTIDGVDWKHTALHQAAFYGRPKMAKMLLEVDDEPLSWTSNPCGLGGAGTPIELARGKGFHNVAKLLQTHIDGC